MKILARIRQLSIRQLWKLSIVLIKRPLLIFPTLRATKQTFNICNTLYGSEHHKSNKANAFRHALWNLLICKNAHKKTKNKQKSVFWAQKITDLYEKVTNNQPLDEAMDLHNNEIGRMAFFNILDGNENEIVIFLQEKMEHAKKVSSVEEMDVNRKELVYLMD